MMKRVIIVLFSCFKAYQKIHARFFRKRDRENASRQIVSGKSWEDFCDTLKAANASLKYPGAPQDAFSQAEGYRYLSRLTRAALEAFLEHADPMFPSLNRLIHETAKLGSDNPDNYYLSAVIDGHYDYRLTGNRNNIHYLGLFTQKGGYGLSGDLAPTGAIEDRDIEIDEDGTFEILLSQKPVSKNWLPITEESNLLMVRQTFLDRENEIPAQLEIECLDRQPDEIRLIKPEIVEKGLARAGLFVAGASMFFSRWARGFQKHVNELPMFDPKISTSAGGAENISYYHSYWKLKLGEVLLIDFVPPECDHWNFQLNNHWMESLDYRYYNIHINKHSAQYKADGAVQIVVAHEDPKMPNWVQTVGHLSGTMCLRWVRADSFPEIKTRVLGFDQLGI